MSENGVMGCKNGLKKAPKRQKKMHKVKKSVQKRRFCAIKFSYMDNN